MNFNMASVITYYLTPIPWSIDAADDFLLKTDKMKRFYNLAKNIDNNAPIPQGTALTFGVGNALFLITKQISSTFEKTCEIYYDMLGTRGLIISRDRYSPYPIIKIVWKESEEILGINRSRTGKPRNQLTGRPNE